MRVAGQKLQISRALKTQTERLRRERTHPYKARTRARTRARRRGAEQRMQIWVDADACPAAIKEILFRAADRARVRVTLVANQSLRIPASPYIRFTQVPAGLDVADRRIVELLAGRRSGRHR